MRLRTFGISFTAGGITSVLVGNTGIGAAMLFAGVTVLEIDRWRRRG